LTFVVIDESSAYCPVLSRVKVEQHPIASISASAIAIAASRYCRIAVGGISSGVVRRTQRWRRSSARRRFQAAGPSRLRYYPGEATFAARHL
jgi:hypothetical protein